MFPDLRRLRCKQTRPAQQHLHPQFQSSTRSFPQWRIRQRGDSTWELLRMGLESTAAGEAHRRRLCHHRQLKALS
jgi:hypothetical protein